MLTSKPKVVKDFDKLGEEVLELIKLNYPRGFTKHLVKFVNPHGQFVSALPFETDDRYYLIRMTIQEAKEIIENDDDFDDDGVLKASAREALEEKYDIDDD